MKCPFLFKWSLTLGCVLAAGLTSFAREAEAPKEKKSSAELQAAKPKNQPATPAKKEPVRPDPKRWTKFIGSFAEQNLTPEQAKGGIVFTGSSSIRMWNLESYFPELPVLNRGFGGSVATDSVHFIKDTVLNYEPKVVVLYTGSNDLNNRLSVDEVYGNYTQLVSLIREGVPGVKIIMNPVKLCNSRPTIDANVLEFNERLKRLAEGQSDLIYIDTASYVVGSDGRPDDSFFLKDRLHLNEKGYDAWVKLLKPVLQEAWNSQQKK